MYLQKKLKRIICEKLNIQITDRQVSKEKFFEKLGIQVMPFSSGYLSPNEILAKIKIKVKFNHIRNTLTSFWTATLCKIRFWRHLSDFEDQKCIPPHQDKEDQVALLQHQIQFHLHNFYWNLFRHSRDLNPKKIKTIIKLQISILPIF